MGGSAVLETNRVGGGIERVGRTQCNCSVFVHDVGVKYM